MSLMDALLLDPYQGLDYYIAFSSDSAGGNGTLNDPWDGSTTDKFDKIMREKIPVNARVHLGPGVFLTKGFYDGASSTYGWQVKAGWKISGSGIDVTTLTLDGATTAQPQFFAIGHALDTGGSPNAPNPVDFCEVSDLTVDCALSSNSGSAAFGAIRLMGNHVRVSRVKVKNWGTKSTAKPCFVISVITADRTAGRGSQGARPRGRRHRRCPLPENSSSSRSFSTASRELKLRRASAVRGGSTKLAIQ